MYWQKRFDRENPDIELEEKIHEIHKRNKDYGYRRMCGELRNQGYIVNKKKVQRIMQKYNLQVMSFTRKSRKYSSYKGRIGTVAPNRIKRRFNTHIPHQKITTDTTEFKLKGILAVVGFPKATYMYWQKRFDRVNPNQELEDKIIEGSAEKVV